MQIVTKLDFTDKWLKAIKCPPGRLQQAFTDTLSKNGFTLTVSSTGLKTFYGFYRNATGRKQRVKIGTAADISLAQARGKWRELRTAIVDGGADPVAERKADTQAARLSDLVAAHLAAITGLRSLPEKTRRLNFNVVPLIGDIKLADLHRRDFTKVFDAMLARGVTKEANLVFEDCRALCNWAFARGDLDHEPMRGMKPPFAPPTTIDDDEDEGGRILTAKEIHHLWRVLPDAVSASTARILKLQLLTACRVSEIACMRLSELNLDARVFRLPRSRSKNKQIHVLPLNDTAVSLISEQIATNENLALRMGRENGDAVFPGKAGEGTLSAESVGRNLNRITLVDKNGDKIVAGLPHWSSHALRKTAATFMEMAGQSPFIVGHVLNHISTTKGTVTSKLYAKYDYFAEKRIAIEVLERQVLAAIEGRSLVVPLALRQMAG